MIKNLCNVFIFVEDQEKAKNFWCDKIGFKLKIEEDMGEYKWLEVSPPFGDTSLVLYPKCLRENSPKSHSTITFFTDDIKSTYKELLSKGVKFKGEPKDTGYGIFTDFEDENGNIFSLKQV